MITTEEIARALDGVDVSALEAAFALCSPAGVALYVRRPRRVAESWAEAFTQRTVVVEDGHVHWTGALSGHGTPVLHLRARTQTAYRWAFRTQYGREPIGRVRSWCDYGGCVAGAHLQDRLMRRGRAGVSDGHS